MNMGRIHDVTKRDFLVYVNGFGVYINVLFAERHKIKEGTEVHKDFMDLHIEEVPPMESVSHYIWRDENTPDLTGEEFTPYQKQLKVES
jgi:hypothetical protein